MPFAPAHYPLSELTWLGDNDWFRGSRVLLRIDGKPAAAEADLASTAIIFVHGWGGTSTDTWEAFPRTLRAMPSAARADIFFLQYPSRSNSTAVCGSKVAEFLLDVLRSPAERIVNPSLPSAAPARKSSTYTRILIVGHSMGAVVARRGLLDLDRDELTNDERKRIRMLFFAPAHKGSDLPLLVQSGLGLDIVPGGSLLGWALTVWFRSLHDLAEGSEALRLLDMDSREAREARADHSSTLATTEATRYLRARVYHADGDKVVSQERFDDDLRPPPGTIRERNHRSVCKPMHHLQDPAAALAAILDEPEVVS